MSPKASMRRLYAAAGSPVTPLVREAVPVRTDTFQLTITGDPRPGRDRAGRAVVDLAADAHREVDPDAGEWVETAPVTYQVRVRGEFAERVHRQVRVGDEVVVTGVPMRPGQDADPSDDDGPLPRLLAVVVSRPLEDIA